MTKQSLKISDGIYNVELTQTVKPTNKHFHVKEGLIEGPLIPHITEGFTVGKLHYYLIHKLRRSTTLECSSSSSSGG